MGRYDDRLTLGTGGTNKSNPKAIVTKNKNIPFKIRYIEIGSSGSTSNTGNHIVNLEAWNMDIVNVALNKTVTSNNTESTTRPWSRVTDGQYADKTLYSSVGSVTTVDLASEYDLALIRLWRYYDGRTYYNTYIKVYNGDKSQSAYVHHYNEQGTYVEDTSGCGRVFSGNHIHFPDTSWSKQKGFNELEMYVGTPSGNKRITRKYNTARTGTGRITFSGGDTMRFADDTHRGFCWNYQTGAQVTLLETYITINQSGIYHYIYSSYYSSTTSAGIIWVDTNRKLWVISKYETGAWNYKDTGLYLNVGQRYYLVVYFSSSSSYYRVRLDSTYKTLNTSGRWENSGYYTRVRIGEKAYSLGSKSGNFTLDTKLKLGGKYYSNVITSAYYNLDGGTHGSTHLEDDDSSGEYDGLLVGTTIQRDEVVTWT